MVKIKILISTLLGIILFTSYFDAQVKKIGYGDPAPIFSLPSISGKTVRLSDFHDEKVLLLFFNPQTQVQKRLLLYSEGLMKKYRNKRLNIFSISRKDESSTKEFIQGLGLSFPVLIDNNGKTHRLYGLQDCCGGVVLRGENGKIVFFSEYFVSEETLRQIIENALLGKIVYDFSLPAEQNLFLRGKETPFYPLKSVDGDQIKNLNELKEDILIVSFFSSFCSICKTGKRIETLIKLKNTLLTKKRIYPRILLVFSGPFDKSEIKEYLRSFPPEFGVYIGPKILNADQIYITDESKKNNPLTVVILNKIIEFAEKIGMSEEELYRSAIKIIETGKGQS